LLYNYKINRAYKRYYYLYKPYKLIYNNRILI